CLIIALCFFQAEDGILDFHVTGVQTCALPIFRLSDALDPLRADEEPPRSDDRRHPGAQQDAWGVHRRRRSAPVGPGLAGGRLHRSEERSVGKGCESLTYRL